MALSKYDYLTAMGIQTWHEKYSAAVSLPESNDGLTSLCAKAGDCTACSLHLTRTQVVFGAGNSNADLMVICDAPGFYEDQQGQPFAGEAGQLLQKMLQAIGLDRNSVYMTSLLKCRLPDNRAPLAYEINQCSGFLAEQMRVVQPKVLLVFGEVAGRLLLGLASSLEELRGQCHLYGELNIPLVVSYHPAHLLLNPQDKRKAWEDLQLVQRLSA